ncbi:MAG TPA: GntR family transcriptional regulator [Chloroflexi bacterium]|nr:GntR family transcriptional regulator [Chloroflexota bacterium]
MDLSDIRQVGSASVKPIASLRRDPRPLYLRIEEALNDLLAQMEAGEQLPSEPKLARQLGVSRSTLREALRSFEERGLVIRKQGIGTFVNTPRPLIPSGLETLESVDVLARRMGLQCETEDLVIERVPASTEAARALGLSPGSSLIQVARLKTTDGVPVAYMVDNVPTTLVSLEALQADFEGSVLDYLRTHATPPPAYARANIIPTRAGPLSTVLRVRPDAVLLLLEEVLYGQDHTPMDYSRNYFVPSYFRFHVVRRVVA